MPDSSNVSRFEEQKVYRSRRTFTRAARNWLMSESAGDPRRAERFLRRAFSELAPPSPAPGFVEETMRRLGIDYRAGSAPDPGRLYKLLVSACLTAAGAALVLVPGFLTPVFASLRPAIVIQWWTSVIVGFSQRIASGFAVWKVLTEIGETVAAALASPLSIAALTIAMMVSFATFRALTGLVSIERGTQNA